MANPDSARKPIAKTDAILITGSAGFLGRNLAARLAATGYENLLYYDVASPEGALEEYADRAAFVFHLAGVNRPQNPQDFYDGNRDLTQRLLSSLARRSTSKTPVVLSSSAQVGSDNDYGKSKKEAEDAVFAYAKKTGADVYVYRLPGVFGKWSRPNYNTVVATFCHNIARGLPIEVRDPAHSFPLCYVDDVVDSFIACLDPTSPLPPLADNAGEDAIYTIDPSYELTLGWLAGTIRSFAATRTTLGLPNMGDDLTRKLWATYLSFLPEEDFAYPLATHRDERGSFTEFLRTREHGQVGVNIAKPGIVKGNHWHDTKNEKFLVVQGRAVIRIRALGSTEVVEYEVAGDDMRVVDIPPGYTHNIENVGDVDLVTIMWASEPYDEESPDTYREKV